MLLYDTPPEIVAFSTTRDGKVFFRPPHLFMPHHQVHGTHSLVIDETFMALNPLEQMLALDGVDAVCTHLPEVCVCVKTADCIPVLLWDEKHRVVSAVHAGWKGTLKRIVEENVSLLCEHYGTQPRHLHAIIGPGIGSESFEVGDEVYALFADAHFPMDLLAQRYPSMHQPEGEKWHIDLWECNRLQLTGMGVPPEQIYVSGIDTYVHHDRFYSARRQLNGRIINGIMMHS